MVDIIGEDDRILIFQGVFFTVKEYAKYYFSCTLNVENTFAESMGMIKLRTFT